MVKLNFPFEMELNHTLDQKHTVSNKAMSKLATNKPNPWSHFDVTKLARFFLQSMAISLYLFLSPSFSLSVFLTHIDDYSFAHSYSNVYMEGWAVPKFCKMKENKKGGGSKLSESCSSLLYVLLWVRVVRSLCLLCIQFFSLMKQMHGCLQLAYNWWWLTWTYVLSLVIYYSVLNSYLDYLYATSTLSHSVDFS